MFARPARAHHHQASFGFVFTPIGHAKILNVKQVAASALARRLRRPNSASIYRVHFVPAHSNAAARQAAITEESWYAERSRSDHGGGAMRGVLASDAPCGSCSVSGCKAMRQNWGRTENADQFERRKCAHSAPQPHRTTVRTRNFTQRTCDSLQDEGAQDVLHTIFNVTCKTFRHATVSTGLSPP